jgi:diguanylate cyclase (GGDEF)-like protein
MKNKIKTLTDMLHNQFKNVLKGKSEILHFHTTNITTFCYLVDNAFNEVDDRYLLFKYQYTETDILEPYEPFLSIIRDTVEKFNIDIKKLLDKSRVYPAHKILFESYLKGQLPVRLDELVDGEILYEVSQLHKSIGRILCSLSDYQPIIIALAELQFADFATLELIKSLKKSLGKSKVMLIHGYNQNTYFVNADHYEVWNDFITFAEENYSILNLGKDIILKQADWTCFKSKKNMTIHKIATISALNLSFLNFNNAIKSGLKAEALLKDTEDINLSYTVLQVLGDSYYYLDKVENALAYYRMFLELAHKKGNYKQVSEAYRKSAMCYIKKYDIETATTLANQCLKFANLIDDDLQLMRAYYLMYLLADISSRSINKNNYFTLLRLLEKYNIKNNYAYYLQDASLYTEFFSLEELHSLCDKGIQISLESENEFSLFVNYHKKGILYTYSEDYENAIKYFLKSKDLRQKLGYPIHLTQIHNAIGYLYLITERYKEAQKHYQKAIGQLTKIHDFNEISATLFNHAFLQFMSRNYENCIKTLDKLLQIMKIFNMTYLPYRTITDIYLIKAFCYYQLGESFKAIDLLNRVDSMSSIKLTFNHRFLYNILKGLIRADKGKIDGFIALFEDASNQLDPSNSSSKFMLPIYYLEYGRKLISIGKKEDGKKVLGEGIAFCNKQNYQYHKKLIEASLTDINSPLTTFNLVNTKLNLDSIIEIARQDVTLNKLQKKIREIEFISKLQELSNSCMDKDTIINSYLDLIHVNFPVDITNIYSKKGDKYKCLASKSSTIAKVEVPMEYIKDLIKKEEPVLLNLTNNSESLTRDNDLKFVINIPINWEPHGTLNLFVATINPHSSLTEDDLNILSISMKQFITILSRVIQELELLEMSRTDILTGLGNRQALQMALKDEFSKIKDSSENENSELSLMFIDLDNFKYYNDNFGHNLGDDLLKIFARFLKESFSSSDFVARFGGDEFIIILPNTNKSTAKLIGENILRKMSDRTSSFQLQIQSLLGEDIIINRENLLTCSIGIASINSKNKDLLSLDKLLKNADEAMYTAKKSGKNAIYVIEKNYIP